MNVLWAAGRSISRSAEDMAALAKANRGLASLPTAQISSDLSAISADISVVTLFFSVRPLLRPEAEEEFAQRFLVNLLAEKKEAVKARLDNIIRFYGELDSPEAMKLAQSAEGPVRRSLFEMEHCLEELTRPPVPEEEAQAAGEDAGEGEESLDSKP